MQETDIGVIYDFNYCSDSLKYIIREPFKTNQEAKEKIKSFLSGNNDKTAF